MREKKMDKLMSKSKLPYHTRRSWAAVEAVRLGGTNVHVHRLPSSLDVVIGVDLDGHPGREVQHHPIRLEHRRR